MLYINNITSDPSQQFTLTGIPGLQISMLLIYRPRVQQWYADISCGNFTVQGLAVVASPNILRKWSNIIQFGLAIVDTNGVDPYAVTDFANQVQNMYLLDSDDVAAVEAYYYTDGT